LRRALALALLVLIGAPAVARAMDDVDVNVDVDVNDQPPGQLRMIRVGIQTLLVDEAGNAILYEDSTPPEAVCAEAQIGCWGFDTQDGAGVAIVGGGDVAAVDPATGQVFVDSGASP
jgi:hypothetical protein